MSEPSKKKIVVVGGINMDLFINAERFPWPGETFEGDSFFTGGGGKGANQAIAAAQLAGPGIVEMVGRVGGDAFGVDLLANLQRYGVGTDSILAVEAEASGIALIFIDGQGENYVLPVYGANATCGQEEVERGRKLMPNASVLLMQQEIPTIVSSAIAKYAREAGVTVIHDPAPVRELPEGYFENVSILVPNQLEAEALTGIGVTDATSAREAAHAIRGTAVPIAIVKLGADGCYVAGDGIDEYFPGHRVDAIATVAAGDAFAGGLATGLAEGMELRDAVHLANAAGALSVTREGAQDSMPPRAEVQVFMESIGS
ncbi:MAG: ribokinase [Chloroflexi bacterium]|nr:ribokinase [Chloroflexota bacterium]